MKKISVLFVLCIMAGMLVSCAGTDASEVSGVSARSIAADLSLGTSMDKDDVLAIFDKARAAYQNSDTVTLSDGTVITTNDAWKTDTATVSAMSEGDRETAGAEYSTYITDVFEIGLDLIRVQFGEEHIIDLTEIPDTVNTPLPSYFVALDLEAGGFSDAYELLEAVRNGEEQYRDSLLMVIGINVSVYDESAEDIVHLYPSESESQIRYALRYGTDAAAE